MSTYATIPENLQGIDRGFVIDVAHVYKRDEQGNLTELAGNNILKVTEARSSSQTTLWLRAKRLYPWRIYW